MKSNRIAELEAEVARLRDECSWLRSELSRRVAVVTPPPPYNLPHILPYTTPYIPDGGGTADWPETVKIWYSSSSSGTALV